MNYLSNFHVRAQMDQTFALKLRRLKIHHLKMKVNTQTIKNCKQRSDFFTLQVKSTFRDTNELQGARIVTCNCLISRSKSNNTRYSQLNAIQNSFNTLVQDAPELAVCVCDYIQRKICCIRVNEHHHQQQLDRMCHHWYQDRLSFHLKDVILIHSNNPINLEEISSYKKRADEVKYIAMYIGEECKKIGEIAGVPAGRTTNCTGSSLLQ